MKSQVSFRCNQMAGHACRTTIIWYYIPSTKNNGLDHKYLHNSSTVHVCICFMGRGWKGYIKACCLQYFVSYSFADQKCIFQWKQPVTQSCPTGFSFGVLFFWLLFSSSLATAVMMRWYAVLFSEGKKKSKEMLAAMWSEHLSEAYILCITSMTNTVCVKCN